MQVFIVGTPLETAEVLYNRRLNKQIIECQQIFHALNGAKTWSNHPCVLQYRGHEEWLNFYLDCLVYYQLALHEESWAKQDSFIIKSHFCSRFAMDVRPPFHTQEYFNQMKKRLYTKDKEHYKQWANFGESYENWYWSQVENKWLKYKQNK
jgi:hypothetical protein